MIINFVILLYIFSAFYISLLLFFTCGIFLLSRKRDTVIKPISVLIAARNEETNIPALITALSGLNYPKDKMEVIVVDDRSTDRTFSLLETEAQQHEWLSCYQVTTESTVITGKKGALDVAIRHSQYEILAFTDADCRPQKDWLSEINALMTPETDFLCGYSPLIGSGSVMNLLKNLERASIFAVIAGSFGWNWDLTSVARNQVYRKSRFEEINGFAEIGQYRSGDDDLLLQKMSHVLRKRNFLFSTAASVPSLDKDSTTDMIALETRRASKWRLYPLSIKLVTLAIFVYYLILMFSLILAPWQVFCIALGLKVITEFLLLTVFLFRIRQLQLLTVFPLAEILYLPYFIYFGLKGTFGKYKWKN